MKTGIKLPIRCEALKNLRKENNKTQCEMAKLLGVTVKTYRSWEKGEYRKDVGMVYPEPGLDKIIEIAENFKCSVDYVLGRSKCKSVENSYISKQTGLSDVSINKLSYINFSNTQEMPDNHQDKTINTINTLIERLNSPLDTTESEIDILHWITAYLYGSSINKDWYYDMHYGILRDSKAQFYTDNIKISAGNDMFKNLLLATIQELLIKLKDEVKKAPDTN